MFKELGKSVADWTVKNAPTILTAVGAAGVVLTAISAGQASIKAKKVIDEMPEDADMKEKAKVVAPIMAKPFLLGAATIFCILAGDRIHARRNAALAACYTLSTKAFDEYSEKVVETIGKTKEKKIRDAIAEDKVNANPPTAELLENEEPDKIICVDDWGRYFKVTPETIDKALNKLNERLKNDEFVCLDDWYEELGLSPVKHGESLGWKYEQKGDPFIELVPPWQQSCVLYKDKYPVRVISFVTEPELGFDD